MNNAIIYDICRKTELYLMKKDLSVDVYPYSSGMPVIVVEIHWGDWKHDHAYCRSLMEDLGASYLNTNVIEEDGSDCYSACHYFLVQEDMFDEVSLVYNS